MDERRQLEHNLQSVRSRMDAAARKSGRDPGSIRLVAVTKRNPSGLVRRLVEAGARDLGENYPQELWKKSEELADTPATWHLIGHLQGNKARKTFPMVRMIHSVDSLKLLQTLDALASEDLGVDPPFVCLQVNTSDEAAKHGWQPTDLVENADAIAACRRIAVVGLMAMAAFGTSAETARPSFARLRALRETLRERTGLRLEHLSMGMSNDFETAIEEGATLVRVGSALFEGIAR